MQTLVLNAANMPIAIYDWKRAVKKICSEKAEIMETYVDENLNDWKSAMSAPAVIRLLHFILPPKKRRYAPVSRKNIWLRDKGVCQYCKIFIPLSKMHWDHVIPLYKGGTNSWYNLCCCCYRCNQLKRNRAPEEAGMKILKKPVPMERTLSLEKEMILKLKSLKNLPHDKWGDYIYYNIELKD